MNRNENKGQNDYNEIYETISESVYLDIFYVNWSLIEASSVCIPFVIKYCPKEVSNCVDHARTLACMMKNESQIKQSIEREKKMWQSSLAGPMAIVSQAHLTYDMYFSYSICICQLNVTLNDIFCCSCDCRSHSKCLIGNLGYKTHRHVWNVIYTRHTHTHMHMTGWPPHINTL